MDYKERVGREFCIEVWGDRACFTRPENKVERKSYDFITPSAARGILESILFKRYAMWWEVTKIEIMNPIKTETLVRNEIPVEYKRMDESIDAEENRSPRYSTILKDVRYRIYARIHFIPVQERPKEAFKVHDPFNENLGKYEGMFLCRVKNGKCCYRSSFGLREFVAHWKYIPVEELNKCDAPLDLNITSSMCFYGWDYKDPKNPEPMFFNAHIEHGVMMVPPADSVNVFKLN